jgi:hypothetical protein
MRDRAPSPWHYVEMIKMRVIKWAKRAAWALIGAGLLAAVVLATQVDFVSELDWRFNLSSVWTWDTLGTWLGAAATVAIAGISAAYTLSSTRRQQRAEARDGLTRGLVIASQVKFTTEPVLGNNHFYEYWRIRTTTAAPVTEVQIRLDGRQLGLTKKVLLPREEGYVWNSEPLNMNPPTRDIEMARSFIKSNIRDKIEIRFMAEGRPFTKDRSDFNPVPDSEIDI